jgi:hypothetical protein
VDFTVPTREVAMTHPPAEAPLCEDVSNPSSSLAQFLPSSSLQAFLPSFKLSLPPPAQVQLGSWGNLQIDCSLFTLPSWLLHYKQLHYSPVHVVSVAT